MSKVWGAGAWAQDAERAEAEERERAAGEGANAPPLDSSFLGEEPAQSFPSLKEAASKQPKKKKKPVPIPLAQFAAKSYGGGRDPSFESKGLTPDEMLRLPTGPRERSQEELDRGRVGSGFRPYGGGGGGGPRGMFPGRRSDDSEGSWGAPEGGQRGYGGFDGELRRGQGHPARASDFDQPSRADEVDNWASGKRTLAQPNLSGRVDRYSSLGGGSSSRADEMDSWSSAKKSFTSDYPTFKTAHKDARVHPDSDRWVRGVVADYGERRKLILDPPKKAIGTPDEPVRTRSGPFGDARPREEVLAKRGLDWKKMEVEIELKKTSRPTSSHSSRPSSAQSSRPGSPGAAMVAAAIAPKPKPKVNPFGDAKPREVLLEEKGVNWRKIDFELGHRSVDRPQTDEEKMLKEEIGHLTAKAADVEGHSEGDSAELSRLHEDIANKERDLELLTQLLDDKVKFGQKSIGGIRPGSGGGRSDTSSTRTISQSGISEDFRNIEIINRPRSRGGPGDTWIKPIDDRRSFQRSRERSSFTSGNVGRSNSRERW